MSDDLPASVRLLWNLEDGSGRRGPKPSLQRDDIVASAIELADEEGLGAVSMARVADRVGVSTMALYRYVANKDELLLLMSDAALGPPMPHRPRRTWRANLGDWARTVRACWLARPWLLSIPVNGPPTGPNNMGWLDAGLRTLAGTSLSPHEQLDVVLLLSTYARGDVWLNVDLARASTTEPADFGLQYDGPFSTLLDPERFPAVTAAIAAGAFGPRPGRADVEHFDVALDLILDGVARRIDDG